MTLIESISRFLERIDSKKRKEILSNYEKRKKKERKKKEIIPLASIPKTSRSLSVAFHSQQGFQRGILRSL